MFAGSDYRNAALLFHGPTSSTEIYINIKRNIFVSVDNGIKDGGHKPDSQFQFVYEISLLGVWCKQTRLIRERGSAGVGEKSWGDGLT